MLHETRVAVSPLGGFGVNWFGLNWTDLLLNVFLLAIVPGFLGALGGHLAAEGLQDEKRRQGIKVILWSMFVVWVLGTIWQQFRVAEFDLEKETRSTWADAEILHSFMPNTAPPLFAYEKTYPRKRVPTPDVALRVRISTINFNVGRKRIR
jgi:hypothetical protein